MSEKPGAGGDKLEQKREILRLAADVRKFEIGLLWQRSLFFWTVLASTFLGYATFREGDFRDAQVLVACFGFVCSLAWTLQNRGSKYWAEAWEQKLEAVEVEVLGCNLFSKVEPRKKNLPWGAWRFSVSGLTIAVSDFVVIVWTGLLYFATGWPLPDDPCVRALAVAGTVSYAVLLAVLNFRRTA